MNYANEQLRNRELQARYIQNIRLHDYGRLSMRYICLSNSIIPIHGRKQKKRESIRKYVNHMFDLIHEYITITHEDISRLL